MKRLFIFIITFFLVFNFKALSQSNYLDSLLVNDQSVKKGVLANGMTYYIKSTDVVKDAASYYIIQNVGSILEDEDQRGLAHFLEHMAFNGTKNFPGKGILNTLQKQGAVFGKDINAYTSFDETVYNMNNIPTKDGLIDTCLTVLQDWSNNLLLTDAEIDAERGVIKEEWRTRQNGQMRLFQKSLPVVYNHTKYQDRMPIGLMSVVENFNYKALRDFYHDWYRTDLQAIAIIGDINVDEIEQKIKTLFSVIPAVSNPKERLFIAIPEHDSLLYNLGKDPEVATATINFGIRHARLQQLKTVGDYKKDLLEKMAIGILSDRISEKAQNPEASFIFAQVGYGEMAPLNNSLSAYISPKPKKQLEAFKEVLTEMVRAVKFGYTPSELDRFKTRIASAYENQIAQQKSKSHAAILNAIKKDYLDNEVITNIEKEYEVFKQLSVSITLNELHETINSLYTPNNRYLNVTGIDTETNLSKKEAESIIEEVENDTSLLPYTENVSGEGLMGSLKIESGTIKKEINNNQLGSTTFVLSNHVTVHYKFVDKEKDKVALNAISYGGLSLLKDEDLPSSFVMTTLMQLSGIGDFNATDLKKVLAGKTASLGLGLSDITEGVYGSSNTKDVETMLQMLHLYFVKPRFDDQAFMRLQSGIDSYVTRRSNDVNEKMKDSITTTLYGKNNPRKHIFDKPYAKEINFDKVKNIYLDRFADVSDFEFFIVGDVSKDQLKPLLETYVASIPSKNRHEKYNPDTTTWLSDKIDTDIYIAMEDPKASVNVVYKKEMPYSIENDIYTSVLGDILQLRLLETVREAEGGAYSPNASANFSKEPVSQAYISFSFDCNPDLVDKMVAIVNAELQKIADGNVNDDDLNKTRTNFIKERQQSKDKNAYDMQWLKTFFRDGYNMEDPKNFEIIVNNMTKLDIQKIAQEVLKNGKSYEIVFKPEE